MRATQDLSGIWHNEQGSELVLEVAEDGKLAGRFRTGVGFGTDELFEIAGFTGRDLVVFCVSFAKYGTLTSWVGHVVDGELRTLWHMALALAHPKDTGDLWRAIWSGANTFRRGPAPSGRRREGTGPLPLWPS